MVGGRSGAARSNQVKRCIEDPWFHAMPKIKTRKFVEDARDYNVRYESITKKSPQINMNFMTYQGRVRNRQNSASRTRILLEARVAHHRDS